MKNTVLIIINKGIVQEVQSNLDMNIFILDFDDNANGHPLLHQISTKPLSVTTTSLEDIVDIRDMLENGL